MKNELNKNKYDSNQTFIIRKDIVWIAMICLIILVVCFSLSYHMFYKSLWGWLMPHSHSHNRYSAMALLAAVFGGPFFTIYLLYHLLTFRFKYLEISKKGINDKMSIFNKEFIPFNKVRVFSVRMNPNHIVVKYGNKSKTFTELNLTKEQAKSLRDMYFSIKHKNNPTKVTNILEHGSRK